jgi:hypothetical protein
VFGGRGPPALIFTTGKDGGRPSIRALRTTLEV